MNYKKFLGAVSAALLIVIAILMLTPCAGAASKYKTLYRFRGHKDGAGPLAGLILDQSGNLYGTTSAGGIGPCNVVGLGCGVVFKLTSNPDGSWTESVLHLFDQGEGDGRIPAAGLIFDTAGNLYGTTETGSANYGIVFELTPKVDGSWTESVLHSFTSGQDGDEPRSGLIFDQAGNLYGTASYGGTHGSGVVFQLTPNPDGGWTESVLHSFNDDGKDGYNIFAGLILDQAGNLYGTTAQGGAHNGGTVFQLTPNPDGSWTESVLYSFTFSDGSFPQAGLIFDQAGNLYGTTAGGGTHNRGVVFELTPNVDGSWTESVLHHFRGRKDGRVPSADLIFDQAGNLYGTTVAGGNLNYCNAAGCGVVFKLTPNSKGGWTETVLHSFRGQPAAHPVAGLIFDETGNLYGTIPGDGSTTFGSVFEITP